MNNAKYAFYLFSYLAIFVFTAFIFLPLSASADIGPKPRISFEFIYQNQDPLSIIEEELWECNISDCSDRVMFDEGFAIQYFDCDPNGAWCGGSGYGFKDYLILVLKLSDGRKIDSNIFKSDNRLYSNYIVKVEDNHLVVSPDLYKNTTESIINALENKGNKIFHNVYYGRYDEIAKAFAITIIIELLLTLVFAFVKKLKKKRLLVSVLVVNLLSLPLFYYLVYNYITGFYSSSFFAFFICELLIVLFEGCLIFLFNKKDITWKSILLLTLINNTITALIGLVM